MNEDTFCQTCGAESGHNYYCPDKVKPTQDEANARRDQADSKADSYRRFCQKWGATNIGLAGAHSEGWDAAMAYMAEQPTAPTAAEVKAYREKHGVGMLTAKAALEQSEFTKLKLLAERYKSNLVIILEIMNRCMGNDFYYTADKEALEEARKALERA